jgi:hypothetical protein
MKIPGAPHLITHGTGIIFEYFRRLHGRANPRPPWKKIPEDVRKEWEAPQIQFAELVVVAVVTDMIETVSSYDGAIGAAYERAIRKYCIEELNFNPAAIGQETEGQHDGDNWRK